MTYFKTNSKSCLHLFIFSRLPISKMIWIFLNQNQRMHWWSRYVFMIFHELFSKLSWKKKLFHEFFFPGWSGWFKATYVKNSKWFESFHGRKRTFVRRINQVRIGIFWIFLIFTNFFPPNFLRIYFKSSRILCPSRQQALYTELKKMRGRGEEMDMLQELEQVKNRLYDRMGCPKFLLYFFFFYYLGFKRGSKAHRISGTRTWKSIFANWVLDGRKNSIIERSGPIESYRKRKCRRIRINE